MNTTEEHPSTWTAMRCANEAGVSLRTAFAYDPNRSTSVPSAGADYLTGVVGSILERIELGGPTNDMTSNATMALYMIGSRLAQAVIDAIE